MKFSRGLLGFSCFTDSDYELVSGIILGLCLVVCCYMLYRGIVV